MIEARQIACALALFGLYALVASIVPHFKSQTAVFVAMFGYNALSVLVWCSLVGLVKWMLRGADEDCEEDSMRPWLVWSIRFLLSVLLACVLVYCTIGVQQWAFRTPASWDRPQFAIGWPIPWKLESPRCMSLGLFAADVLLDIFLALFLCGFRKGRPLAFAISLSVALVLVLAAGVINQMGTDNL